MTLALAQLPLLIEIDELNALLNEQEEAFVLVDLGKAERFEQAHIPGARLVTPGETQRGAPIPGLLPETAALEAMMARLGIGQDTPVIVYDDEGGGWAGRFIWLLDEIGHRNHAYLNGGLSAWLDEGLATQQGSSARASTIIGPQLNTQSKGEHSYSIEELQAALADGLITIWDARSAQEHSGEKAIAKRPGRIPGARHYEWTDAMDKNRALRLKPLEQLRSELAQVGIDDSKAIATHCQSHHRSGLSYLVGRLLGFDIKAYAGSYGEWGNREDTAIEQD